MLRAFYLTRNVWVLHSSDHNQIDFPVQQYLKIIEHPEVGPRWRRDGKEIFYLAPNDKLMAAAVTITGGRVEVGAVRALFDVRPGGGGGSFYDVSADGQRFLIKMATREPTPAPITVVVNWTAGLQK